MTESTATVRIDAGRSDGTSRNGALPPHDARLAGRACYLSPVRVLRDDGVVDGTSRDISASGLLVALPAASLTVGTTVGVRFALPVSGSVVSVRGTVMRVVPSRGAGIDVGLRLSFVPDEAQREIEAFAAALGAADVAEAPASR